MAAFNPNAGDWRYMLSNAGRVLGSLAWWQYAVDGTFAMKGAQTLPPLILGTIILGGLVSLTGAGRQFVLVALIGAIPCWVSAPGGNSHRMMMMLLPLALLAGATPLVVPARYRSGAAAVLVAAIALTGMRTWLSPDFWVRAGVPPSVVWTPPVRTLVQQALDRAPSTTPSTTVRVYPNEGSVRLLAAERGMPLFLFDLRTADFARKDPLTVFWRYSHPTTEALFQYATSSDALHVEPITEVLTRTDFPRGWQGLLGDPPQFGWRFSKHCAHPVASGGDLDFVVPLVLEDSPGSGQEPCAFRWTARAAERMEHLTLRSAANVQGVVRIDDTVILMRPIVELPPIGVGQRISIEAESGINGIFLLLHPLNWEAVRPDS
jgi:hypothetical protein